MTKTLSPAIQFIARTSSALIKEEDDMAIFATEQGSRQVNDTSIEKQAVRWALDAPRPLRSLLQNGNTEDARKLRRDQGELKTAKLQYHRLQLEQMLYKQEVLVRKNDCLSLFAQLAITNPASCGL